MTVDHAQAIEDAHAAGVTAGKLHRHHGVTPVPPATRCPAAC